MKLAVMDTQNKKTADIEVPSQLTESYRPDLIRRAVLAIQSAARQAYGANPDAGQRHSSELSKRRRKYRGCYGFGISRVNRKIHSRRGTRFFWVGATSPQTRGGRRSHAPKSEKQFDQKVNKKENRMAIRSAMSATLNKNIVGERGHRVPEGYPFALDASVENLNRTKDVESTFQTLGFTDELERSLIRKVRAGVGKLRGRKYRRRAGPLVVVSGECPLEKSAKNLGITVVRANALNAELLAPGTLPGRVTLWTTKALDLIKNDKLFM